MTALHVEHGGPASWLPLVPLVLAALAYGVGVARLRRRGDAWARRRLAAALAGLLVLAAALLPPITHRAAEFPGHVVQHLLVSGLAPLLLALSAPVTLALRTLANPGRRVLLRALHSRLARVGLHPVVVVVVNLGGLYAFYLTPAYAAAQGQPALHAAVHLHMVAAGCLLSWYLVGVDPVPRRGGTATRLIVLVTAAAGHDVLAKLLYAHTLPLGGGSAREIQAGAQLMFYGGSLVEVALAVALLAGWYARGGRDLRRAERRLLIATTGPTRPSGKVTAR